MLRPADISSSNYPVALKPTLGFEMHLSVSTDNVYEVGTLEVAAVNSGTFTANAADNVSLGNDPKEILAMLETEARLGGQDLVITLSGTDQNNAPLTATATFKVPAYSSMTQRVFPKSFAQEAIPTVDGKKFKTVGISSVACAADAVGVKVTLFGVPSLDSFRKIGCRTQLDFEPKTPKPQSVQCGRDMSAFVKSGEIPEGKLTVAAKIPTFSDGLARVNGVRVCGLIEEIKEDTLTTMHIFVLGLIMTSRATVGESIDPATLEADALYEDIAMILAQ